MGVGEGQMLPPPHTHTKSMIIVTIILTKKGLIIQRSYLV
jgi:hypothetical protein